MSVMSHGGSVIIILGGHTGRHGVHETDNSSGAPPINELRACMMSRTLNIVSEPAKGSWYNYGCMVRVFTRK